MPAKLILINTDTHVVVPREPTHEMVFAVYNCKSSLPENEIRSAIAAAPPLTTPPVLRWEGNNLMCGNEPIAYVDHGVNFGSVVFNTIRRDGFKTIDGGLDEARRAAEKALGFPDGLVVEEA